MPHPRPDIRLAGVDGREFDEMLYPGSIGGLGHRMVSPCEVVPRIDQQHRIGSLKGWGQRRCVREIADKYIDAIPVTHLRRLRVPYKDPRPVARL
jgi:hypothetical protein